MRVGGGEEGREVLLRRDIKWGGIICLVVREGRGYYLVLVEGLGLVIRAEATSVLGLRVIGVGGGVGFRAVQNPQAWSATTFCPMGKARWVVDDATNAMLESIFKFEPI